MTTFEQIVKSYNPKNLDETKLIVREFVQQIILVGLSRGGFFKYASFYGGTALRIFYGLNRYSEDLDFTLNTNSNDFSLEPYLSKIKNTASSYGISLDTNIKTKKIETPIESAFAKLNTYQTFISLNLNKDMISTLHKDEVIKIKFEIDCHPSLGFNTTTKWLDVPEFANVSVLDESSLFSGKIHAILCRNYKGHVKGRDYYDFLFYIKKRVKPNLIYLRNKLIDSRKIDVNAHFNIEVLKDMLKKKVKEVDFEEVKEETSRFLIQNEDLSYYCLELFEQMIDKIE